MNFTSKNHPKDLRGKKRISNFAPTKSIDNNKLKNINKKV